MKSPTHASRQRRAAVGVHRNRVLQTAASHGERPRGPAHRPHRCPSRPAADGGRGVRRPVERQRSRRRPRDGANGREPARRACVEQGLVERVASQTDGRAITLRLTTARAGRARTLAPSTTSGVRLHHQGLVPGRSPAVRPTTPQVRGRDRIIASPSRGRLRTSPLRNSLRIDARAGGHLAARPSERASKTCQRAKATAAPTCELRTFLARGTHR